MASSAVAREEGRVVRACLQRARKQAHTAHLSPSHPRRPAAYVIARSHRGPLQAAPDPAPTDIVGFAVRVPGHQHPKPLRCTRPRPRPYPGPRPQAWPQRQQQGQPRLQPRNQRRTSSRQTLIHLLLYFRGTKNSSCGEIGPKK